MSQNHEKGVQISWHDPFKEELDAYYTKISILTPRCAVRLHITPQSLTQRYDAHGLVFWEIWVTWLPGVMHTVESDYFENVHYRVFEFVTSFNYVISKHVWSKKRFLEQFVTISIICIVISYL